MEILNGSATFALHMGWKPSGELVYRIAWGLARTWRVHRFGLEHVHAAQRMSPHGAFMVLLWHQSLLSGISVHRGMRVAALASRSGDGDVISDYLKRMGIRPVRGSSARGAVQAARDLIETIEQGYIIAITCDGPKGPFKAMKSGPLELARRHQVPIVPLAFRATRELSIKASWDRFRVPLPGAHIAVVYGEPVFYPPGDVDAATLEARRMAMERIMGQLEADASERCGKPFDLPPDVRKRWS